MKDVAKTCPFCGSSDTVKQSDFGTSLMVAWRYCRACRSNFESIKWGDTEESLDIPAWLRRTGPNE